MTVEDLRKIAKSLPAVTEDIKWENHLCFNVGEKMFVISSPDEVPVGLSLKVSEDDFDMLSARPGFSPAPYLARYHWIKISDIEVLSKKEGSELIKNSYALVASRLSRAIKKKFGLQ